MHESLAQGLACWIFDRMKQLYEPYEPEPERLDYPDAIDVEGWEADDCLAPVPLPSRFVPRDRVRFRPTGSDPTETPA